MSGKKKKRKGALKTFKSSNVKVSFFYVSHSLLTINMYKVMMCLLYHKGKFLPSLITESELCIMGTLSVLVISLKA